MINNRLLAQEELIVSSGGID